MDLLSVNDPSGEHPSSYYFASANKINNFQPLKDNISCDVCVIGGGFTGLSAAIIPVLYGYIAGSILESSFTKKFNT